LTILVFRFPKEDKTERIKQLMEDTGEASKWNEIIDQAIEIGNSLGL